MQHTYTYTYTYTYPNFHHLFIVNHGVIHVHSYKTVHCYSSIGFIMCSCNIHHHICHIHSVNEKRCVARRIYTLFIPGSKSEHLDLTSIQTWDLVYIGVGHILLVRAVGIHQLNIEVQVRFWCMTRSDEDAKTCVHRVFLLEC